MALDGVGGETDQLDTTLGELWLELGEGAQLSCADWSVILWVREEDDPFVTDELVEVDWAGGGLGLEVWGNGTQAESVGGEKGISKCVFVYIVNIKREL